MNYICTKKLSLAGKDYQPGHVIPDSAFTGDRAKKLKAYGYIASVPGTTDGQPLPAPATSQAAESLSVILDTGAGGAKVACLINTEQLQTVIDLMQKTAGAAAEAIAVEIDETVLTFIARVDSRKAVKEAAEKQLSVIASLGGGSDAPADAGKSGNQSES